MRPYAGAARRRVHLATVLRPPSGHRPGLRQAREARFLQIGPPDANMKPVDAPHFLFALANIWSHTRAIARPVPALFLTRSSGH